MNRYIVRGTSNLPYFVFGLIFFLAATLSKCSRKQVRTANRCVPQRSEEHTETGRARGTHRLYQVCTANRCVPQRSEEHTETGRARGTHRLRAKFQKRFFRACLRFAVFICILSGFCLPLTAQNQEAANGLPIPFVNLTVREPDSNAETAFSIQLLLLLTVITLAPSIAILMTSFLRISVVLDFVKRALSLQQVPPNTVLMGIALFLTLFVMFPTFTAVYQEAFMPYSNGEIEAGDFYTRAISPLRYFMYRQMAGDTKNITLFMNLSGLNKPETFADVPTYVLIPAFVLHELVVAFRIGIYIYVPFIIIDMLVASVLMSMGMIMLPPVMISMPFKLILFVLVDGWTLLVRQLLMGFM